MDDDKYYLTLALGLAHEQSKDPSTHVGAIIVNKNDPITSVIFGTNNLPEGITSVDMKDREAKLRCVVHAEMNAILYAARRGHELEGATMYMLAQKADKSFAPWGGAPCTRCTVEIIQAGIKEVVSITGELPEYWKADCEYAKGLLKEAGVEFRQVEYDR